MVRGILRAHYMYDWCVSRLVEKHDVIFLGQTPPFAFLCTFLARFMLRGLLALVHGVSSYQRRAL